MIGTISYFDVARDFGFAKRDDSGGAAFIGGAELRKNGIMTVAPGDRVSFDLELDKGGRRPRAIDVQLVH